MRQSAGHWTRKNKRENKKKKEKTKEKKTKETQKEKMRENKRKTKRKKNARIQKKNKKKKQKKNKREEKILYKQNSRLDMSLGKEVKGSAVEPRFRGRTSRRPTDHPASADPPVVGHRHVDSTPSLAFPVRWVTSFCRVARTDLVLPIARPDRVSLPKNQS